MAIQMRRGMKVAFDPYKMLPGEWAVSVDAETENQIIWMCFRAGVVKRMGTYEDFREQILEITEDIREEFSQTINEIKEYMEGLKSDTEGYKNTAEQKAEQAYVSATNAANSADASEDYALKSQSYAEGTGGVVRPDDDSDCAKFYYEQTRRISQGVEGVIPMGTITFAELALPHNEVPRYMFDISDDFITDERFKNGSGIYYGTGSNVIRTGDDMWDVLTPVSVMGVKGDKETSYRQGFVNITPEDIGAATIEDLQGINADFVGTKAELDALIESGEYTENMTVYLTDGGGSGDGSGGGELSADLQERIEVLEEKTQINTWDNAGLVAKAIKPEQANNPQAGYSLERLFTWSQLPFDNGKPGWALDWRYVGCNLLTGYMVGGEAIGLLKKGKTMKLINIVDPMFFEVILKFYVNSGSSKACIPYRRLINAGDLYAQLNYYGYYGYIMDMYKGSNVSDKYVEITTIYAEDLSKMADVSVVYHFETVHERETYRSIDLVIDEFTATNIPSGVVGNVYMELIPIGTNAYASGVKTEV